MIDLLARLKVRQAEKSYHPEDAVPYHVNGQWSATLNLLHQACRHDLQMKPLLTMTVANGQASAGFMYNCSRHGVLGMASVKASVSTSWPGLQMENHAVIIVRVRPPFALDFLFNEQQSKELLIVPWRAATSTE